MATTAFCPTICEERRRLDGAVWCAVRELVELRDQPAAAVRVGGLVLERFHLARKLAVQRHADAKRAALLHVGDDCR